MSYQNFSRDQEEMIRQIKKVHSKGELLQNIPDDMKKRLNDVMNNEAELKKILSSERAKALFDIINDDENR